MFDIGKEWNIIDISMDISNNMPVYKGRASKRPIITVDTDYKKGRVYESRIEMNLHTGTHIDSPWHIIEGGKNLDEFDLKRVITKCQVFDFTECDEKITEDKLKEKSISEGDFILLKTKNSIKDILEGDFIYLDKSGARYLKDLKISGVGIDALGIERNQPEHETHKLLLQASIVILEGLRLKNVKEGEYLLCALPIKLTGVEAAPVRAVLINTI